MASNNGVFKARGKAAKLLAKYKIDSAPIDVKELAKKEGCKLTQFEGQNDISGMLKRFDKKNVIAYNDSHPETRKRFTIAHEIGHLICHYDRDVFVDKTQRVNFRNARSGLAIDQQEIEANAFAASLLMPKNLIEQEASSLISGGMVTQVDELIEKLADTFQVSSQAMEYRLKNLGIIDADFEYFG